MSRPNRTVIEAMIRALLEHKFKDQVKRLGATNVKLFGKAYNKLYDPTIQVKMSELETLRPRAFAKASQMDVNAGGYSVSVGGYIQFPMVKPIQQQIEPRPFLQCDRGYNSRLDITDQKLIDEVQTFVQDVEKLKVDIRTAHSELEAALSAFTTYKKLAEGWPEAMPIIGSLIPENNRSLPAVRVDELNAKFGLPPETATKKKGIK